MEHDNGFEHISCLPETSAFDQLISRVRNMLAYGMPTTEVYETLLNEGFSNDEVYFTIMAAKVLDKD